LSVGFYLNIQVGKLERRVWPFPHHSFTGAEYYFEIVNSSECEPLENGRVELIALVPDVIGYLPVPLHIKHDTYEQREFSINPGSTRQVDLITGPINHPISQKEMIIAHTVNSDRVPIPLGKYRLTVRVSAKNSPPATAVFEAWINKDGELRWVRL
jgi:hypothetical protein